LAMEQCSSGTQMQGARPATRNALPTQPPG